MGWAFDQASSAPLGSQQVFMPFFSASSRRLRASSGSSISFLRSPLSVLRSPLSILRFTGSASFSSVWPECDIASQAYGLMGAGCRSRVARCGEDRGNILICSRTSLAGFVPPQKRSIPKLTCQYRVRRHRLSA